MIAVIFEVYPNPDNKQKYLDIAAELKPLLADIDGFSPIECFASLQLILKFYPFLFGKMKKLFKNGETWKFIELVKQKE